MQTLAIVSATVPDSSLTAQETFDVCQYTVLDYFTLV